MRGRVTTSDRQILGAPALSPNLTPWFEAQVIVEMPPQIASHPIRFGSDEWTCVVGEFEGGGRMVTVAKWRDGTIAEEYIWM
jgi:hypothetical protein